MEQFIFEYIRLVLRRIREKSRYLLVAVALISFGILGMGMMFNPKYETAITIYADNKNVIKPLLEGQAAVTTPRTERIRIVKETMFSPRLLAGEQAGCPGRNGQELAVTSVERRKRRNHVQDNQI